MCAEEQIRERKEKEEYERQSSYAIHRELVSTSGYHMIMQQVPPPPSFFIGISLLEHLLFALEHLLLLLEHLLFSVEHHPLPQEHILLS